MYVKTRIAQMLKKALNHESKRCITHKKKPRMCAIMPMSLMHIKEHMWTTRKYPTTVLLSDSNS